MLHLDAGDASPQTLETLQLAIATLPFQSQQFSFDRDASVPIATHQLRSRRFSSNRDASALECRRCFILRNI
nr:hypothetical protein CFP56_22755 [Quercus suber]